MHALALGALVSLAHAILRRDAAPLLVVATFAPIAITSWLNLDVNAASRYAIGYLALHTLLAADGFRVIGRKRIVQCAICAAVIVTAAVWTWPALQTQRNSDAPPSAAMLWVVRNVPPGDALYVTDAARPHADYFLTGRRFVEFQSEDDVPQEGDAWIVDLKVRNGAHNFVYPRHSIWKILRRRNFEASVDRVSGLIRYGEGWHGHEGAGLETWRWTAGEARATLPQVRGSGRLAMRIRAPLDELARRPDVSVFFNDRLIERFVGLQSDVERSWVLESRTGEANELRIVTSETVNLAKRGLSDDSRELGLRIENLSWLPVR
jgi:hypothetical protein